jgi:hypothetical protein
MEAAGGDGGTRTDFDAVDVRPRAFKALESV